MTDHTDIPDDSIHDGQGTYDVVLLVVDRVVGDVGVGGHDSPPGSVLRLSLIHI